MNTTINILNLYIDYINTNGKKPISAGAFCKEIGVEETVLYDQFASLKAIENAIFNGFIISTIQRLNNDETYAKYSIREKLLAFHYTLLEELKKQRSFVCFYFEHTRWGKTLWLEGLREPIKEYLNNLVNEGIESGEIPNRFNIHKIYADSGYFQTISVIHFWAHDNSDQLEKTDGFIERAVNFTMDIISRNSLDSGFEFGKFLLQQIKK